MLLTIGSGIGLSAFPILISDFLLLNFARNRKFYNKLKQYDFKKELKTTNLEVTNEQILKISAIDLKNGN